MTKIKLFSFMATLSLITSCASTPPTNQGNICKIFAQEPGWFNDAKKSENKWGTPISTLMSFVRQESSYRKNAKPPIRWVAFIPLGRPTSAKGYAQALDPVWKEYKAERGKLLKSRSDMSDALDFIGWYNQKSHNQLGIRLNDPENLYLAYHEGRGGFSRGSYNKKPKLRKIAKKVARTAFQYETQLTKCRKLYECYGFHKFWPFCRK
ncbi:hypothetical protein OA344_02310 [Pseudomonadota bacterium]|nr:hypothetical protein [Pseudomonadota bacterium]